MTKNVIPFSERRNTRPAIKSCMDCKFRIGRNPNNWKCGLSGFYCTVESGFGDCGTAKILWSPRPPREPGFWSRLGDAIIERVKGKR